MSAPGRRRARKGLAALAALGALAGCGRCGPGDAPSLDAGALADGGAGACAADGPTLELGVDLVDVGAAIPLPGGGVAIALARGAGAADAASRGAREGVVARLAAGATTLDLRPTARLAADAPPPTIARAADGAILAVSFAEDVPDGGRARRVLVVERLDPAATTRLGAVEAGSGEGQGAALALGDGGAGVVVWDEERARDGGPPGAPPAFGPPVRRGVVRAAALAPSGLGSVTTLSAELDAERPAAIAVPGGFVVAWLASSPEPVDEADRDAAEGPGELRARRWIEVRRLDVGGAPRGEVERGGTGYERATSFVLAPTVPPRPPGAALFVADEAAVHETEGGRLLRLQLEPRLGASLSAQPVAEGVARLHDGLDGLPPLVESPDERLGVLVEASDPDGGAGAAARDVGLAAGARAVATAGPGALWVVSARPGSARAALGRVACPRLAATARGVAVP